jgi:hypothetical protein
MEEFMTATAVGLFTDASVAESVAKALRAIAVPPRGIRIISSPANAAADGVSSTPKNDFVANLSRDLHSMGAVDHEIDAYLAGVRRGNVLVFATGTLAQADAASAVMNTYEPIEVEEFTNTATSPKSSRAAEAGAHDFNSSAERKRVRHDGARLFSW